MQDKQICQICTGTQSCASQIRACELLYSILQHVPTHIPNKALFPPLTPTNFQTYFPYTSHLSHTPLPPSFLSTYPFPSFFNLGLISIQSWLNFSLTISVLLLFSEHSHRSLGYHRAALWVHYPYICKFWGRCLWSTHL